MNDLELKAIFPFGATAIRGGDDPASTEVLVGGDSYEEDEFKVLLWDTPFHSLSATRDFKPRDDGYVTHVGSTEYFLRPLTKEREFKF